MNDQQRAAMQMALEALEALAQHTEYYGDEDEVGVFVCCGEVSYKPHSAYCKTMKSITALREALAQPQENTARCGGCSKTAKDGWALYCVECWEKAQPQGTFIDEGTKQGEWVDLTDDEIDEIESKILMAGGEHNDIYRAVIAADRELNK